MRWMMLGLLAVACAKSSRPEVAVEPAAATDATAEVAPTPAEEAPVSHPWLDVPARRIDVDGTGLFVLDTGGEGTPILLVHGLGSTLSFWQKQLVGGLAEEHRLIAVDLPGWGRSDQPDGAYTPSWYADHLVGVLDALDVGRAHVAGHSMGGQAAIAMALEHPDRVDRLVLVAPAGIETFTAEEGAALKGFWTEDKLRDRPREEARLAFSMVFATWDEGVDRVFEERLAVDGTDRFPGLFRALQRSVDGMIDEPVADRLGEVSTPTLVVFGDADAMIPNRFMHPDLTTQAVGEQAVERIPDARLVLIPGAGHTPHHDEPAAFDAAVRDFLAGGPTAD